MIINQNHDFDTCSKNVDDDDDVNDFYCYQNDDDINDSYQNSGVLKTW